MNEQTTDRDKRRMLGVVLIAFFAIFSTFGYLLSSGNSCVLNITIEPADADETIQYQIIVNGERIATGDISPDSPQTKTYKYRFSILDGNKDITVAALSETNATFRNIDLQTISVEPGGNYTLRLAV